MWFKQVPQDTFIMDYNRQLKFQNISEDSELVSEESGTNTVPESEVLKGSLLYSCIIEGLLLYSCLLY